jgi:hypothetical protein
MSKERPTIEDVAVLYAMLATYFPSDLRAAVQNIVSESMDTNPKPGPVAPNEGEK